MVTPGRTVAAVPIHTFFSMAIGSAAVSEGDLELCCLGSRLSDDYEYRTTNEPGESGPNDAESQVVHGKAQLYAGSANFAAKTLIR